MRILSTILRQMYGWLIYKGKIVIVKYVIFVWLLIYEKLIRYANKQLFYANVLLNVDQSKPAG